MSNEIVVRVSMNGSDVKIDPKVSGNYDPKQLAQDLGAHVAGSINKADDPAAAQKARASKYGIQILADTHLTPPAGYPTDEAEYADPVNFKYPIHDAAHVRNALARLAQNKSEYDEKSYKIVDDRIDAAAKKFGIAPAADADADDDDNVKKSELKVTKTESGADWQIECPIFKVNDEKRLVGGIVYEPDVEDAQGDSASADEIEKAAHGFMMHSRTVGVQHADAAPDTHVVESFICPQDMRYGNQTIKKGSWVMVVKVNDDGLWNDVKAGKYTGFSMAGTARDAGQPKA